MQNFMSSVCLIIGGKNNGWNGEDKASSPVSCLWGWAKGKGTLSFYFCARLDRRLPGRAFLKLLIYSEEKLRKKNISSISIRWPDETDSKPICSQIDSKGLSTSKYDSRAKSLFNVSNFQQFRCSYISSSFRDKTSLDWVILSSIAPLTVHIL